MPGGGFPAIYLISSHSACSWQALMNSIQYGGQGSPNKTDHCAVWDISSVSDQSMHLAKWIPALEQVTVKHLVKCPKSVKCDKFLILIQGTWPSGMHRHSAK